MTNAFCLFDIVQFIPTSIVSVRYHVFLSVISFVFDVVPICLMTYIEQTNSKF